MKNQNIWIIVVITIIFLMCFGTYEYYTCSTTDTDNYEDVQKARKNDKIERLKRGFFAGSNQLCEQFTPGFPGSCAAGAPYYPSQYPNYNKQILESLVRSYPSIYDDPYRYPNVILPPQVIGCGHRRGACMGGSQIPIPNTLPPVNISEQNIAPVNLTVRGFDEGIQQVGTIQKVFGKDNFVYPLFGRRRYRNDNKWDYFVKFGKYGVILPTVPLRNNEELNTNDRVFIQGQEDEYRVTIYDSDIPQYLPFT